jgi:uncharacterized Zn-binding protein involved in type VI secretion
LTSVVAGKTVKAEYSVNAVSPNNYARVGYYVDCPADSHGCPACPHHVIGTIAAGSPNITINGLPAARVGDVGTHVQCCGANTFVIFSGDAEVLIDGKPAARIGDTTKHCGGMGKIVGSDKPVIPDIPTPPPTVKNQPIIETAQPTVSVQEKKNNNLSWLQQRNVLGGYLATPSGTTTEVRNTSLSIPSESSTDYGPLRITWSGTSFSGKIDYKSGGTIFTATVQGSVSADGKTLTDFTYSDTARTGNTASDHFAVIKTHSYSLQNLQMSISPDNVIAMGRTAPLASYAGKIVDEEQQYYDGKLWKKNTFKSAEWATNSEFRLTFNIVK